MVQQEIDFKIKILEKENRDLKALLTNLKVDNEEYRQQINQLKQACKELTKESMVTADKIPVKLELDPIDYIKQWNQEHLPK